MGTLQIRFNAYLITSKMPIRVETIVSKLFMNSPIMYRVNQSSDTILKEVAGKIVWSRKCK